MTRGSSRVDRQAILVGMQRRADIEGLRAVAVLAVLLFHAGVPGLAGGYVGVDVFFVVSGFLITSLLVNEKETSGTISLSSFYARRIRRLLPVSAVVASLLLLPHGYGLSLSVFVLSQMMFLRLQRFHPTLFSPVEARTICNQHCLRRPCSTIGALLSKSSFMWCGQS